MKVTKDRKWLNRDMLSAEKTGFSILGTEQDGNDLILIITNDKQGLCGMSLWGDNKNKMIDKFGTDTDNWTGKPIFLHVEQSPNGKNYVILSC